MLDFEFIRENALFIATGIGATVGVTIFSFLLSTPAAMLVARGRHSALLPIKALSRFYVWLMDGLPMLLQIFFIFLALPQLGIFIPGVWGVSVLAITINYGAHMSHIFYERSVSIEEKQSNTWPALIPSLANEFASMLKDTTLLSMTGFLHDVMWRAMKVGRADFKNVEAILIAAIIYLALITCISWSTTILKSMIPATESSTAVIH